MTSQALNRQPAAAPASNRRVLVLLGELEVECASHSLLEGLYQLRSEIDFCLLTMVDGPLRRLAEAVGRVMVVPISDVRGYHSPAQHHDREVERHTLLKSIADFDPDLVYINTGVALELAGYLELGGRRALLHLHREPLAQHGIPWFSVFDDWAGPKTILWQPMPSDLSNAERTRPPDYLLPEISQALSAALGIKFRAYAFGAKTREECEQLWIERLFLRSFGLIPDLVAPKDRITAFPAQRTDRRFLMFITGRCGSTWLSHLMEGTGQVGTPHEFFNESALRAYRIATGHPCSPRAYLDRLVPLFSRQGIFGTQIDPQRFDSLAHLIDWQATFPPERTVYLCMRRRDIVAQAFSFALAQRTQKWHKFQTTEADTAVVSAPECLMVEDADVWRFIAGLVHNESRIDHILSGLGAHAHQIYYEDLLEDRNAVIARVLESLGVAPENQAEMLATIPDITLRNSVDEVGQRAFRARYASVLERYEADRFGSGREILCEFLSRNPAFAAP